MPDPRKRMQDKRLTESPQPADEEQDEDDLADELAYLMGQRIVEED